jgi:hypothetical protein
MVRAGLELAQFVVSQFQLDDLLDALAPELHRHANELAFYAILAGAAAEGA